MFKLTIIILTIIIYINLVNSLDYQDCSIYGTCRTSTTSTTTVNNNSLNVNNSQFLQGLNSTQVANLYNENDTLQSVTNRNSTTYKNVSIMSRLGIGILNPNSSLHIKTESFIFDSNRGGLLIDGSNGVESTLAMKPYDGGQVVGFRGYNENGNLTASINFNVGSSRSDNGSITFLTKSLNGLNFRDNGFLSIYTFGSTDSIPQRPLTVYSTNTSIPQLRLGNGNDNFYWDIGREGLSTGRLQIINKQNNNATEFLTILTNGSIGIGTVTPRSRLEVRGNISVSDNITLMEGGKIVLNGGDSYNNNVVYTGSIGGTTADVSLSMFAGGTASSGWNDGPYFGLRGNTFDGLSNQKGHLFFVAGNIASPIGKSGSIGFSSPSSSIDFRTTTSDVVQLTIQNNGNVGIGQNYSNSRLEINGSFNVSGNSTFNGNINARNINISNESEGVSIKGQRALTIIGTGSNANIIIGDGGNIGMIASASTQNLLIDNGVSPSITTGDYNHCYGYQSCRQLSSGSYNQGNGVYSLYWTNTGSRNIGIGYYSSSYFNGNSNDNIGIGPFAMSRVSGTITQSNNTAIGSYAGFGVSGSNNVYIGFESGYNQSGSNLIFIDNKRREKVNDSFIWGNIEQRFININASLFTNSVYIKDNLSVTGNTTINNYYGEMYCKNDSGCGVIDLTTNNTYVAMSNQTAGNLNGFILNDGSNLTAQVSGVYSVNSKVAVFGGSPPGQYGMKLYLNETGQNNCYDHFHVGTDEVSMIISCIVRINAGQDVSIRFDDHASPVTDLTIVASNLNLVRIGN